jgi:hypothetical protein
LSEADRALGPLDGSVLTLPNPDLFVFMDVRKVSAMNAGLEQISDPDGARVLVDAGVGARAHIEGAKAESQGLGLFVRSLIGLDRESAKQALDGFLSNRTLAANQIEFVNLVVNHLTEHGTMEAARLYESPFTDLTPRGPEGLFSRPAIDELIAVFERVRQTAIAAQVGPALGVHSSGVHPDAPGCGQAHGRPRGVPIDMLGRWPVTHPHDRLDVLSDLLLRHRAPRTPLWAIVMNEGAWLRERHGAGTLENPVSDVGRLVTYAVRLDRRARDTSSASN